MSMEVMVLIAILLTIVAGALIGFRIRTECGPDEALVRFGQGGTLIVMKGGCIALPLVHEVVRVPLGLMSMHVKQDVFTDDDQHPRLSVDFQVRVDPRPVAVRSAAVTLGSRDPDPTWRLREKISYVLRYEAAGRNLLELETNRDRFERDVKNYSEGDFAFHGFTLVSVKVHVDSPASPAGSAVYKHPHLSVSGN